MSLRLFTKTYSKDLPWLELAMISVARHCTDPVDWTIVCDRGELNELMATVAKVKSRMGMTIPMGVMEVQSRWPDAAELGPGYIQQQWVKMNAHRVMGNDYFLNWDSDVVALRGFSAASFKNKTDKPIMWFTPFNNLIQGGDARIHKLRQDYIKNIFLLPEAPFEWMRCMPLWMNGEILRVGSERPEWERVRTLMKSHMVDGLSEFNLIGQLSSMFFPDAYEWKNTDNAGPTWSGPLDSETAIVHQAWSWGGVRRDVHDLVMRSLA